MIFRYILRYGNPIKVGRILKEEGVIDDLGHLSHKYVADELFSGEEPPEKTIEVDEKIDITISKCPLKKCNHKFIKLFVALIIFAKIHCVLSRKKLARKKKID